jgi:hypothetical protein
MGADGLVASVPLTEVYHHEAPAFLERSKTRATGPQVAVWQRTEARYAADLPGLFAEVRAAADGVITRQEANQLARVQNRADLHIYRLNHNAHVQ